MNILKKRGRKILSLFLLVTMSIVCFSMDSKIAEAATKTITNQVFIGGNEGYIVTINSNFSYTGDIGYRYAKVTSFVYDVSRNRQHTSNTPSVNIKKIHLTWGATGFTLEKKFQNESSSTYVTSKHGTIDVNSSWKKIYVDDAIGVTGANICVEYTQNGKTKYATALANFDGMTITSSGR